MANDMTQETIPLTSTDRPESLAVNKEATNIFSASTVLEKLRVQELGSPIILGVDLDGTFEGGTVPQQIRAICDALSIPVIFITSRTEEMTFSAEDYRRTHEAGQIKRPMAQLKQTADANGQRKFEVVPPESLESYRGQLSPDAVAAETGAVIYARQPSGEYIKDTDYEEGIDQESWRNEALAVVGKLLLDKITGEKMAHLLPIEDAQNYLDGNADVWPPDWRIQIDFKAEEKDTSTTGATDQVSTGAVLTADEAIDRKNKFLEEVEAYKKAGNSVPFETVDDSNPEKGRATVYALRPGANKQSAVSRMMRQISKNLGRPPVELSPTIAGDSFTDLLTVKAVVGNPNATLLIVGGSRLSKTLYEAIKNPDPKTHFAGESLVRLITSLKPTDQEGVYRLYKGPKVILGDYAYNGTTRAETILAYLMDVLKNVPDDGKAYKRAQEIIESFKSA